MKTLRLNHKNGLESTELRTENHHGSWRTSRWESWKGSDWSKLNRSDDRGGMSESESEEKLLEESRDLMEMGWELEK